MVSSRAEQGRHPPLCLDQQVHTKARRIKDRMCEHEDDVDTSVESVSDAEGDASDFFTPEKGRLLHNRGGLSSPSPCKKKRCRPGSFAFVSPAPSLGFSPITQAHGKLNRSVMTATTVASATSSSSSSDEENDADLCEHEQMDTGEAKPSCGAGDEDMEGDHEWEGLATVPMRISDAALEGTVPPGEVEHLQLRVKRFSMASDEDEQDQGRHLRNCRAGWHGAQTRRWMDEHAEGSQRGQGSEVLPFNQNPFLSSVSRSSSVRRRSRNVLGIMQRGSDVASLMRAQEGLDGRVSRYTREFEEICVLGEGRYSSVRGCIHRLDGCPYAVKRVAHRLRTEQERARCLREAYAWAALSDCPKVVRYHGAWIDDGYLHIQMELCVGGRLEDAAFGQQKRPVPSTLQSYLAPSARPNERGGWKGTEHELLHVLKDVALALHHMHRRGIAHQSVNPMNIFMTADGSFKLSGMGHAVLTDGTLAPVDDGYHRYTDSATVASTSAELLPDERALVLTAGDIFSLGATIVEVGTRARLPASGPAWHQIREGHVPKVPGVSPRLQELLEAMMHPDNRQRPQASTVLMTAVVMLSTGHGSRFFSSADTSSEADVAVCGSDAMTEELETLLGQRGSHEFRLMPSSHSMGEL